ncbi:MAG: hypothetical protein NTX45_05155 [Proteobacteria bacterium]|nr:hypothetical protein [Pseudomonadota bacterium]
MNCLVNFRSVQTSLNGQFSFGVNTAEHPKRFLTATVAVGTVDQALLSVLQTKHAPLRSVCLDRALLVVDEVHASDAYMRYLLRGLLTHHVKNLHGHAMLLSATLGAVSKDEFLRACGCQVAFTQDFASACAVPYPICTDLKRTSKPLRRIDEGKNKPIHFELRPNQKGRWKGWLPPCKPGHECC